MDARYWQRSTWLKHGSCAAQTATLASAAVFGCATATFLALATTPNALATGSTSIERNDTTGHPIGKQRQHWLKVIRDAKVPMNHRVAAARQLLGAHGSQTRELLIRELAPSGNTNAQRSVVQALAEVAPQTLIQFQETLLALLASDNETLVEAVGKALGKIEDRKLVRTLTILAMDATQPILSRRGAILTLCHHRNQKIADMLIQLTAANQPQMVRSTAFKALRVLTGRSDLADDHQQWQHWWTNHHSLGHQQWQQILLENLATQARRLTATQRQLESRLVMALRQAYLAQSQKAGSALLIKWLGDEVPAIRLLALESVEQRLIDVEAPPIEEPLRAALRSGLDDSLPVIRRRTAQALSDLRDNTAARIVAERLDRRRETEIEVLRAYLKLIRNVPRPEAVLPCIQLLHDPHLCSKAADVLAEVDRSWLSQAEIVQITTQMRRQLRSAATPNPSMIRLLGRTASLNSPEDWQLIAGFLDSSVDTVKDAAARAWAQSRQPLKDLADRAADPVIQPFLYDATIQRGKLPQTLQQLVKHRPETTSLQNAWQQAILALAELVAAEAVVDADRVLATDGQNTDLREKLLATTVGRLIANPHAPQTRGNDKPTTSGSRTVMSPTLVDLLLARAELRLDSGQAKQAMDSYQHIKTNDHQQMTQARQNRFVLGLIRTHLALDQVDRGLATARPILQNPSTNSAVIQMRSRVIQLLLNTTDDSISANQPDAANRLLSGLGATLAQRVPEDVQRQIDALRARLSQPQAAAAPGHIHRQQEPTSLETPLQRNR